MRKLIESTHVTLGGETDSPQDWTFPYLDDEHTAYASSLLLSADALLVGRRTHEGLSAAYTSIPPNDFVDRMNTLPQCVASTTLNEAQWNATIIGGDATTFVTELKEQPGKNILKYGTVHSTPHSWATTSSTSFTCPSRPSPAGRVRTCSISSTSDLSSS